VRALRFAALAAALVAPPLGADEVDAYVERVLAEEKVPGVAVLVARDGAIERARGYGIANLEHGVPVTADTIFQSGSVGKMFTAAGILLLAEEGKLALDDPVARHFPDAPAGWHRITIRHLLTHTSGLEDYGEEIDLRRDYTEEELLRVMQGLPLEFEPGTQWSYSNSGYLTLGILTSKLAGAHWSEFQAERIFSPLGMATTRVISERDLVAHRAAGYELDEQGEVKNQAWVAPSLNRCADGALYFSVNDLAAWERTLARRGLLRPESFEAWWTPVRLANGTQAPYGFGWGLSEQRGERLIEHGGSWQGFRAAYARYVDRGLTVAVLANLAQAEPERMAHEIAGRLEPALRLRDPRAGAPDADPTRSARLREVLEAWAGWRIVPAMSAGLAETASGSAREAYARRRTGERLAALESFYTLGEDRLSPAAAALLGNGAARAVDTLLTTGGERFVYRFLLDDEERVLGFQAEER
jgi:CubicO group peptidase (beta-lactamase class C family)